MYNAPGACLNMLSSVFNAPEIELILPQIIHAQGAAAPGAAVPGAAAPGA